MCSRKKNTTKAQTGRARNTKRKDKPATFFALANKTGFLDGSLLGACYAASHSSRCCSWIKYRFLGRPLGYLVFSIVALIGDHIY